MVEVADGPGVALPHGDLPIEPTAGAVVMAAPGRCESCGMRQATRQMAEYAGAEHAGALRCDTCPPYDNCSSYGPARLLVRRAAWDALPDDRKRRGRTPAHETQYGSAVSAAHDSDSAPAVLIPDPVSGATVLMPAIIVDGKARA
jgi:hypothetical protein